MPSKSIRTLLATTCAFLLLGAHALGSSGLAVASGGCGVGASPSGGGKVFLSVDEALELAFPKCEIERETFYLTKEQKKEAKRLAKIDVDKGIVYRYTATKKDKVVGYAYFDTHKVRTLRETVLFVVDLDAKISRIELCSFAEPVQYIPRGKWYGQFVGKKLDDELNLKRGIRGVTGATLTARATTRAARRVLAMHAVVSKRKKG